MNQRERLDHLRQSAIEEFWSLSVRSTNHADLFQLRVIRYPPLREEEKCVEDVVSGIGVIAVGKRYALETRGPVEVRDDGLDEGVGAHDESDLAESVHCGDHTLNDPVQLVRGDHWARGAARFTVELLYLSQRERVGGESVGFGPG